jgi:hypothetical protein
MRTGKLLNTNILRPTLNPPAAEHREKADHRREQSRQAPERSRGAYDLEQEAHKPVEAKPGVFSGRYTRGRADSNQHVGPRRTWQQTAALAF